MISGQNSHRILGCPICGYRVDPRDHICPRCGSEFYEGTKFECPFCGGLVSSKDRTCPSCNVDYSDFRERTIARGSDDSIDELLTEIIGLESNQVKKEDKRYSCPNCSWMLDGSESLCPRCNHDLVVDLSFQCPVCGAIVSSNTSACPECGANFEETGEAAKTKSVELEQPKVESKQLAAPETVHAPEPTPPPSPPREVKPIVIVKPPRIIAKTQEERAPEPPLIPEQVTQQPEHATEKTEETIEKLEKHLEHEAEMDKVSDQLSEMAKQTPKKGTKRRKLKARPKV